MYLKNNNELVFKNYEGSITIFYSIIFMVLLAFCATIVDSTRLHIALGQSQRALVLANESILSSYDSQLLNQYGIFGKSVKSEGIIKNNIEYYMKQTLIPSKVESNSIFSNQENFFNLYQYEISIEELSNLKYITEYGYTKGQILEFMKYRGPLLTLTPFLNNLQSFQKSAKTTEILEKKNEVVSQLASIQQLLISLENNIDGLNIDADTGEFTYDSAGRIELADNYIKKLVQDGTLSYYEYEDFPNNYLVNELNSDRWFVDYDLRFYKIFLDLMDEKMAEIITMYESYCDINEEIDDLKDERNELERPSTSDDDYFTKIESYYDKRGEYTDEISDLKDDRDDIEEEIEELVSDYDKLSDNAYDYVLKINDICDVLNHGDSGSSIDSIIDESLDVIDNILKEAGSLEVEISNLKAMAKNEDGEYIEETCESIYEEIENYEKLLGLNEEGEFDKINDMGNMKKNLQFNKILLEDLREDIEFIVLDFNDIHGALVDNNMNILSTDDAEEFLKDPMIDVDYDKLDSDYYSLTVSKLKELENTLESYTRDFKFDYSNLTSYIDDEFDFAMYIENKKDEVDLDFGIIDAVSHVIGDDSLPSKYANSINPSSYELDSDVLSNYKEEYNFLNEVDNSFESYKFVANMGSNIENVVLDIRDIMYINEYVVGMFANASEQDLFGLLEESNAITLNGYDKLEHYLNYEVEYILFGQDSDIENLFKVISLIFTIRIVMNMLHIVTSSAKMSKINALASSVAGWWSLGLGGAILAVVITIVWATIESIIDIQALLKNEEIPLIKTELNWKSDFFSGLTSSAKDAVGETTKNTIENTGVEGVENFSYNDYLRLLLLINIVDEETKIYRILDLIQLNMTRERQEKVELNDYVYSFESKGEIQLDTLFIDSDIFSRVIGNKYEFLTFDIFDKASY